MQRKDLRRKINRGLKPPLREQEWELLQVLFGDRFEYDDLIEEDDDTAEEDARDMRQAVLRMRQVYGLRLEPRSAAPSITDNVGVSRASTSVIWAPTPSDRIYGAIAALQASGLPQVVTYRRRYLAGGLLGLEEVPAYLAAQSDRVEPRAEVLAGRMRSEGLNVEEYPASLYYLATVYRGRSGSKLEALTKVLEGLEGRYAWGVTTCLQLLLCGKLPEGFSRSCGVANLAAGAQGGGMGALVLRVPEYAEQDEVERLFGQARSMLGPDRGTRFSEKSAQAVVYAVQGILAGKSIAAIAREWSDNPQQGAAFRREWYRALARVGRSLGPPAVHAAARKAKGARGLSA